jgi:excisionase family DNA binding protein
MALSDHTELESLPHATEPVTVPEAVRPSLVDLYNLLSDSAHGAGQFTLVAADRRAVALPSTMVQLLRQVVGTLAKGDALTLVAVHQELTTQQAADLLNVSRQYLVRLLDEGKLAYHKTGTHRRLKLEDVLEYRRRRDSERMQSLAELSRMTQELGGYPELE